MRRKNSIILIGFILVVTLFIAGYASAFTANNLDIAVKDNDDAVITFDYSLSWYESVAVFARIGDPTTELKKALQSTSGKNVDVNSTSGNRAQFIVYGMATRQNHDNGIIITTPAISFKGAESALNKYWFAPFINPDFSPAVTRISFPDGYDVVYYNQDQIPQVRHILISPAQ